MARKYFEQNLIQMMKTEYNFQIFSIQFADQVRRMWFV